MSVRRFFVLLIFVFLLLNLSCCEQNSNSELDITTESNITTAIVYDTTVTEPEASEEVLETTESVVEEPPIDETALQESFSNDRIPWYGKSRLIYHAGGAVGEMTYTNSVEAIEKTLADGNRLLEIDFLFTSDGHLVCLHEWKNFFGMIQPCTLERFLSLKIYNRFTTISAEALIGYMREYPDMYLIIDTKEDRLGDVVEELLNLCEHDSTVADRFVIQLYDCGMKTQITELYPFGADNFLFTAYKFGADRITDIMNLCIEEEIRIVAVQYGSWDKATVQQFKDAGIFVFEHTVNDTIRTNNALARGVYGFYTDSLQSADVWIDTDN